MVNAVGLFKAEDVGIAAKGQSWMETTRRSGVAESGNWSPFSLARFLMVTHLPSDTSRNGFGGGIVKAQFAGLADEHHALGNPPLRADLGELALQGLEAVHVG